MWERNTYLLPHVYAPTGDQTHNPGMCPDWELNQQSFALWDNTQPTELHLSGKFFNSFNKYLPNGYYVQVSPRHLIYIISISGPNSILDRLRLREIKGFAQGCTAIIVTKLLFILNTELSQSATMFP